MAYLPTSIGAPAVGARPRATGAHARPVVRALPFGRLPDPTELHAQLDMLGGVTSLLCTDPTVQEVGAGGGHLMDLADASLPAARQDIQNAATRVGSTTYVRMPIKRETILAVKVAVLSAVLAYSSVPTPGVLAGAIDGVVGKLQRIGRPKMRLDQFSNLRLLGKGSFGEVFQAEMKDGRAVVIKRCDDFGAAEVHMNRRVSIGYSETCAPYLGDFVHQVVANDGTKKIEQWLVWAFEGTSTLESQMKRPDFPECMEVPLLGYSLADEYGQDRVGRHTEMLRVIVSQLLENLMKLHSTGIIHRDIKPENVILGANTDKKSPWKGSSRLKFIDLGAGADIRGGVNYVPEDALLTPIYCPPEETIMPTSTAAPPAVPLAVALSPVLWMLNRPDKFDMWSLGMVIMQLACPALRSDRNLRLFDEQLAEADFDLKKWRKQANWQLFASRERGEYGLLKMRSGLELLDERNMAAWDLVCKLLRRTPSRRISAAEALSHPFIVGYEEEKIAFGAGAWSRRSYDGLDPGSSRFMDSLMDVAARSGTEEYGGFTERQLKETKEESLRDQPLPNNRLSSWALRGGDLTSRRDGGSGEGDGSPPPDSRMVQFKD